MSQLTTYSDNTTDSRAIADLVSNSSMFPAWRGKKKDAALAIMFGKSLGLSWGHSLLNIAVINSRPTIWGDAMLALCRKAPTFEYCHEEFDKKTMTAMCKVKRKGEPEHVCTFSKEDAQTAKLWGKAGTWTNYPARMLQMRARSFALRDVFADVLMGIISAEEVSDYPTQDNYTVHEFEEQLSRSDQMAEMLTTKEEVVEEAMESPQLSADFEKKRKGAFKGFSTLGISEDVIFAFFKKSSINEFNKHDVEHLIQIGKSITAGEIELEDAFKGIATVEGIHEVVNEQ